MTEEIESAVENAWFEGQGVRVQNAIHAEDEMYLLTASMRPEWPRRRAEYMRTGYEPVLILDHVLDRMERSWGDVSSVLEFACGFGRTTRFLVQRISPDRIISSDLLPGSVEWVAERFGVRGVPSASDPDSLDLGGPFDLIYVGSLFSHLPRARFEAFLGRLFESLAPQGLLVFTTHGADKVESMSKDPSGFTFHRQSESRCLDVEDYGSTFVTPGVLIEIAAGRGIRHLTRVDRHLWTTQDVWVASPAPLPKFPENAPLVRGGILRADVSSEGHGWVGGFARIPANAGPIRSVGIRLGGVEFEALLSPPKEMSSIASGAAESFLHHEWYLEGSLKPLEPGFYPLSATAVPTNGPRVCFSARELLLPE